MNDNLETQQMPFEEIPASAKSRRWRWAALGVSLVVLLAAAAFLGGRYLQKGALTQGAGSGPSLVVDTGGPGGARTFNMGDIIPAEELPKTEADVRGIFISRQDNSVFVGTGQVQLNLAVDSSGSAQSGASYDGPLVEVVTTVNTQIYRDDTLKDLKELPSGEKIHQKVVPGDLDEVGQTSAVRAWGKKVGDRLVADVLVYSQPQILNAPLR